MVAFSTADLHDGHPDLVKVIDLQFRNFGANECFYGQVETLRVSSDHVAVRNMVKTQGRGRVLVVDGGADLSIGILGDQIASRAIENGWAGIVITGAVRDTKVLDTLPIGIRALGTTARRSSTEQVGQPGVVLRIGGVTIEPGDWLYADRDAAVVSKVALPLPLATH